MFSFLRQNKNFLIALFIFSFLVRAVVFIGYLSKNHNYWQVDSNTYHVVAMQIAQGKGISVPNEDKRDMPCFYRLPGYPLFLAIFYKLFGADTKKVLWAQILIASLIPILVFLLSLSLFPTNLILAKIAGAYSAIHLGFVLYSGFFMTETLFIFLFLIFLFLFLSCMHLFFCPLPTSFNRYGAEKSDTPFYFFALPESVATGDAYFLLMDDMFSDEMRQMASVCAGIPFQSTSPILFGSGVALGIASLVRPVGHYLIILAVLLILCSNGRFKLKIRKMLFTVLGWLIPVSFWLARNYMLTGALFFHTLPGGHFLYLSAARVAMHKYDVSYQQARDILKNEVDELIQQATKLKKRELMEIEKCRIHEVLAIKYFKEMPFIAMKNWFTDILRTCSSLYSAEILYIESGRANVDYFNKDRTFLSAVKRYIFPDTDKVWLKFLIFTEILLFLFLLIGFIAGAMQVIFFAIKRWADYDQQQLCAWMTSSAFIALFIIISLSGGYARMRLPVEPLLIVLSLSFWLGLLQRARI